jgi:hypothetical protein
MRFVRLVITLLLVHVSPAVAAQEVTASVLSHPSHIYSLPQYTDELDRLSSLANSARRNAAAEAMGDLRGGWKIEAEGRTFAIDTGWIFDQFRKLQENPNDAAARDQVLQRIMTLKADAEAFQHDAQDSGSYHAALDEILARKEFHLVHGPTWLDRLKYRIERWLIRILSHVFESSSVPAIGRAIVWTLVAIAVVVLAWVIYREIKKNARLETIMPEVLPVSAKQWSVWMAEARAAAAKGLWRDAVHLAYWAGISFLEESGMWRPDRARTPREYLRLISPNSEVRPALSTLTRQLEVTWYGNQPAGPETFADTVARLEELGCRQP